MRGPSSVRSARSTRPGCPTSRAWTRSPGRRSTPPGGTTTVDLSLDTRFALIGAGASGFQIAPTIADEVEQLTVYQRTAQWVFPNANYHRRVPDGERWAITAPAVLRTMVPLPHVLPGRRPLDRALTHRSRLRRRRARRQRVEPRDARPVRRPHARAARWRRRARGQGDPRLPRHREADAPGQRLVARVPTEGQRRARSHGYRTDRGGRRDHRRRHLPSRRRHLLRHRFPPQRLPLADEDHRPRRLCPARAVGRRTDGVPRHHGEELPQPLLSLRTRDEPRARCEPDLPVRVPGGLRDECLARAARCRESAPSSRGPRSRTSTPTGTSTRSRRWCGRTSR